MREISSTSAASHTRDTLRHIVETCPFDKEMGPQGFSVNAIVR